MAKEKKTPQQFSIDPAAQQMLIRAGLAGHRHGVLARGSDAGL